MAFATYYVRSDNCFYISRFFASKPDSESEYTPSEDQPPREKRVSRALRLSPTHEEDHPRALRLSPTDHPREVRTLDLLSESSLEGTASGLICESVPESPLESASQTSGMVSRVVRRPSEGFSLARKRLFERFGYSKTPKKPRIQQADPPLMFDGLESSATDGCGLGQSTKNESSVSGICPLAQEPSELDSMQSLPSQPGSLSQQQSQYSEMDVDSEVEDSSPSPSVDGPSRPRRAILSSEDFITSAASSSSSASVESMLEGSSQKTERSDSVDVVDLTSRRFSPPSSLEPVARSQPARVSECACYGTIM